MSYRIYINFKNCYKKDIYKNLQQFSKLIYENAEDLIRENRYFCHFNVELTFEENKEIIDKFLEDLFSFHIWYCEKIKSLCFVFDTNVKEVNHFFDGMVEFQDSCDNDYDLDTWLFNKTFKNEVDKAKQLTNDQIFDFMKNRYYYTNEDRQEIDDHKYEYYRKSIVYDKCYGLISPIWKEGFRISYLKGALDEFKLQLRRIAFKVLTQECPKFQNYINSFYKEK